MAAKLLLINPSRRGHKAKRRRSAAKRARRRNPMPAALARYWGKRRGSGGKAKRRASRRRRNPLRMPSVRGLLGGVVPMVNEAAVGAVGSIAVDYLWGQVNPRLPAAMQTTPGATGAGDAVKALATVLAGNFAARLPVVGRYSRRMAAGALVVQLERVVRAMLPDSVRMQLAYASPAGVSNGTWWTGPNRVFRGSPLVLPNTLNALQRPGGRTPLLSALQRPGGRTPLLSMLPIEAAGGLGRARPAPASAGLRF